MHNDLMLRLARRSHLSKKFGFRYVDGCWPHLEIDHPVGVARLVGEAMQDAGNGRVFLRGQVQPHNAMLPSLFRGNSANPDTLRAAEQDLVERIRQTIHVGRFGRPNLPALLQHYGFRTSWLDVVDNLFVAIWFATNDLRPAADFSIVISPSSEEHGWLYLIASTAGSRQLQCVDLRTGHNPLSSRPLVQHGVSLARLDPTEYDLRDFVVATVRFPTRNLTATGSLFGGSVLFPPPADDHTLRLLVKHQVSDIAADIERRHGLSPQALGRVSQLRSPSSAQNAPL